MKKLGFFSLAVFTSLLTSVPYTSFADTSTNPRYDLSNLVYEGAFRLPKGEFGESQVAWGRGTITMNRDGKSFFLTGAGHQAVAEFPVPSVVSNSDRLAEVPIIDAPIQDFSVVMDRTQTENIDGIDQIVGMLHLDGKLVINAARYYDGAADNQDTTLIVENSENLASSDVRGFMKFQGLVHAAGWVSPIPTEYQSVFGHDYIAGNASNLSINARQSMGPSAFLVDSDAILSSRPGEYIESYRLLDFSIGNPLAEDLQNSSGGNDLWTELSEAHYGFIIPGTRTYMTIGNSAGHESGVGYKITQPNGRQCGGFCASDHTDQYNYVWLWDVNDLIASLNGEIEPHEIKPYYYGKIEMPFESSEDGSYTENLIAGAAMSPDNKLYIVLEGADRLQSNYDPLPIVLVFDLFPSRTRPNAPVDLSVE
jgi:hypothetical protein